VTATELPMLHSDAFAWYMERDPVLRSTVVAVIRLDRAPDWKRLRARTDRLTRLVPSLRMRVQEPPLRIGPPRWTPHDGFDLDFHLRRMRVAVPGGWDQVLEFARTAAMDDFDRSRPLWEFTLLDGLADGGAALVTKLHHSLTDGIGGIQLAALVVDAGPDEPRLDPAPPPPLGVEPSALGLAARAVADEVQSGAVAAAQLTRALPGTVVGALRRPVGAARTLVRDAVSVGRFVAPVNEQFSTVLGRRQTGRVLATLDLPFRELHAAAAAAGAHLNDAYLAGLGEGLRRYHDRHGAPLDAVRVTVPVSIRSNGDGIGGNRITLARITMPTAAGDPAERMQHIATIIRRWRHEPALHHAQPIAFALNLLPRAYLGGIFKRVEMVASDVPGLPTEVWLAGARVTGYYGFGPTIGSAVNATLLSYAGTCNVGLNIDTGAVEDPDELIECLHEGFETILALGRAAVGTGRSGRRLDAVP
jgi:diacylglycerol O-acyltransferase